MKRDELLAQIKSGTIKDIYLFYGQETYLMRAALEEIKKVLEEQSRAAGGDLDYINADGREINGEQITELCTTASFVSPRKLIAVEDYPPLIGKDAQAEPCLLEYIDNPADAVLVFYCTQDVVKTSPLFKKLVKQGESVEFLTPSETELEKFIRGELKKYGRSIDADALRFLISYTDTGLCMLVPELNKLALSSDGIIDRKAVEETVTPARDYKIYRLTDFVFEKKKSDAAALSDMLISQREEPIYILAILSKTVRNCLIYKSMKKSGSTDSEICASLGVKDFALRRIAGYCRCYPLSVFTKCSDVLLAADEKMKASALAAEDIFTYTVSAIIEILETADKK
ncbi:MAG: DNA polymerase III subunit delta [Oscillospiraceae bacterium]|nr:MAG: DNA polymerase III subunit delta [Oscillospiraceae bacterium]